MNKRFLFNIFASLMAAIIMVLGGAYSAFADTGPKPSITVKLENIGTTDYLIDLFVHEPERYNDEMDCRCGADDNEARKLYELNFDGWISATTRDSFLLNGDIEGNGDYTNDFSYFGVPDVYKVVVIDQRTGEVRITDTLTRKSFNEAITIDYRSMRAVRIGAGEGFMWQAVIILIVTVLVELCIAYLMKIRDWHTIVIVNIMTNIVLQLAFWACPQINYWLIFGLGEILVFLAESVMYLSLLKVENKKLILPYAVVANVATVLLTLVVGMVL